MKEATQFLDEKLIDELFDELSEDSMLVSDASCGGCGLCGIQPGVPGNPPTFPW